MPRIDRQEFEELVARSLDDIPTEFRDLLKNIEVFIEEEPDRRTLRQLGIHRGGTLFGLYEGVPLPERSEFAFPPMPDRITIYRLPILAACRSRAEIVEQVKLTVVHEVAHHFGISDERLHELGYG